MSAVQPISAQQAGEFARLMKDRGIGGDVIQTRLIEAPDRSAALITALGDHTQQVELLLKALDQAPELLAATMAELGAKLDARPKFGDHLLAERGITVIAGAERGRNVPDGTALADLRPKTFLKPGESRILGSQVQDRALDETGPCFAPWGRDLLWRFLNEGAPEDLDRSKYYVFAGDKDLQDS
ncbi:MAG: hypothetical protein Q7S64_02555, partial [bacterium]|nr:hypothetical protein [bacterium]